MNNSNDRGNRMRHKLIAVMALASLAAIATAQESNSDAEDEDVTTEQTDADEPAEVIDESGLDQQGFEASDEDDFVPTEDIPADQSIPFPTDI